MRERRLAIAGLVAAVMLLTWGRPQLSLGLDTDSPTRVSVALDLKQAKATLTIVTGAAALLAEAR